MRSLVTMATEGGMEEGENKTRIEGWIGDVIDVIFIKVYPYI